MLAGAYAAGTLIGALPGGWLAARAGVKATVLVGLTLMSVSGWPSPSARRSSWSTSRASCRAWAGRARGRAAWRGWPARRRASAAARSIGGVLGAAIFGVQLGPVVGALATAIGREAAFSTTVLFGMALGGVGARRCPRPAARQVLTAPAAALRQRSMLAGMWLTALPAAAFGVLDVLAPLRLDALGATGLALGATFFAAAGVEAIIAPGAGRAADRRGALPVARVGLAIGAVALVVLQLPDSAWAAGDRRRASPPACSACSGCRPGCC